jgi:Cu/Ag efflux pump CusA
VRAVLEGVDGVVDPRIEAEVVEPTVEVQPDLAAARRLGIKPGDIRRAAAALVQGIPVGALFEEQKVFEVIVAGVPSVRESVSSVENLLIDTPAGGQVRLADVASVRVVPAPSIVRRDAVSRRLDVVADVSGRGLDDVVADIEAGLEGVEFPLEYHAEVLADSREDRDAAIRLAGFALAALIGIYLLLQAAVRSWRLSALLFVTLPAAVAGGVVAMLVIGDGLSLGAAAGLLCVFGIAVRNAVALVAGYERLESEAGEALDRDTLLRAAQERLTPVVVTAVATALALAPFLVPGDIAGFEIVHPMAIVAIAGLVTSTLFTLAVVPALYLVAGASAELAAEERLMGDVVRPVETRPPAAVTAFAADRPAGNTSS